MKPYKKGHFAFCNQGVRGSSPCGGTIFLNNINSLKKHSFHARLQVVLYVTYMSQILVIEWKCLKFIELCKSLENQGRKGFVTLMPVFR